MLKARKALEVKMKLPVIEFDEHAHKFNKDSYAMEQKLAPLHVSKNKIPFEEILPNQYKSAAKMYSFKTDKNSPCYMDKILTVKILETNRRIPQLYGQLERQTCIRNTR